MMKTCGSLAWIGVTLDGSDDWYAEILMLEANAINRELRQRRRRDLRGYEVLSALDGAASVAAPHILP